MSKNSKPQKIAQAKGRPMLTWVGKRPIEAIEYYPAQEKEVYGDVSGKTHNRLYWGDNMQVLSHLLKEYRGKINLIYIDPPFDSKADYVKKVKIRGQKLEGEQQSLIEEKQYTDIWENDEYLQFMYERLLIMRELLADTGSIYLHCDWRRDSQIRLLCDEVFGSDNFRNEIVWKKDAAGKGGKAGSMYWPRTTDTILLYVKNKGATFRQLPKKLGSTQIKEFRYKDPDGRKFKRTTLGHYTAKSIKEMEGKNLIYTSSSGQQYKKYYLDSYSIPIDCIWDDIPGFGVATSSKERLDYPTQKPEALLERIVKASSNPGDIVMDCFCGSGTAMAVAQKLGRHWIGCDINRGAIQTTTKRLLTTLNKSKDQKSTTQGFKVYNVNDYDIFKNEIQATELIMQAYGVEPIKQKYFDGMLGTSLVKVVSPNRVLNKLDVTTIIKEVESTMDTFTVRRTSKTGEETYEESVIVLCSGVEPDTYDYIKKENSTGVRIEIRDIQRDKKKLTFKKHPEVRIDVSIDGQKATISIQEFFSPLVMQKLAMQNEQVLTDERHVSVDDFKQIIDSVAIDIDYTGKLFNAEIMDIPQKNAVISGSYSHTYEKPGTYTIAVKIVDVLGEESFDTFSVSTAS